MGYLVELWARGARCPIAFLIAYELQEGEDVKGQHNYAQNKKNQVPQHIAWHHVNKRSDTILDRFSSLCLSVPRELPKNPITLDLRKS